MIRYDGFVIRPVDDPDQGNVAIGVSVAVRVKSTLALANIYSDEAGTLVLDNPLTTNDTGRYSFYADTGDYIIDVEDGSASIAISLFSWADIQAYIDSRT